MLRDVCVAATGSWSANQVYEMAVICEFRGRRADALAEIRKACGSGTIARGKRRRKLVPGTPIELVPELVPVPTRKMVPGDLQKRKKEAKKEKSPVNAPKNTSYSSPPEIADVDFGDLEPEIAAFLAVVAAENKSGKMTVARAMALRRELAEVRADCGDDRALAYGLRAAIKAEAGNTNYVRKAMRSGGNGASHAAQNGNGANGTGLFDRVGTGLFENNDTEQLPRFDDLPEFRAGLRAPK